MAWYAQHLHNSLGPVAYKGPRQPSSHLVEQVTKPVLIQALPTLTSQLQLPYIYHLPNLAQCLPNTAFPSPRPSFPSTSRSTSLRSTPMMQPHPHPPSPSSLLTHFFPTAPSPATTHSLPSRASVATLALPARHLLHHESLPLHRRVSHRFQLFLRLTQSIRFRRRLLKR